ncbi:MAG: glucosaminidase domain-containing protein [Chloroflexi bacterium]|nr:glucosaminidase domain-containing protein [Chloroflexota bacterium]
MRPVFGFRPLGLSRAAGWCRHQHALALALVQRRPGMLALGIVLLATLVWPRLPSVPPPPPARAAPLSGFAQEQLQPEDKAELSPEVAARALQQQGSGRADPPLPPSEAPEAARLPFLPEWVQPPEAVALWFSADPQAARSGRVPAWEFLHVLGARRNRLEVEYAAGRGWVHVWEVVPAQEPGRWLRSLDQLRLWASPLSGAALRVLPAASLLRVQQEDPANGRAQVEAYDQNGRRLAEGWVAFQGLQAIAVPRLPLLAPLQPQPRVSVDKLFGSRQGFVERVGAAAREVSAISHIPASVTVAQAILESSWGESRLAREANNYFGIKAHTEIGPAGLVWMPTAEVLDGQDVRVTEVFRAYNNLGESVRDHHRFLLEQPRYKAALGVSDPAVFVQRVAAAGYSTDPGYVDKVLTLIQQNNLTRFDRPVASGQ